MLEKIIAIEERYQEISRELESIGSDYQRAAELGIERAELEPVVQSAQKYRRILTRLEEARQLQDFPDEELRQLAEF